MQDPNEFIADFSVWGMIHALTIRSPIAKGTLKEISIPNLPDSFHLITAQHIPGENRLADFPVTVLANNSLSYIGQPVAVLTGPEKSRLEELASQVEIITEEESPDFAHSPENIVIKRDIENGLQPNNEDGKTVTGLYKTGIQEHWYAEPNGAVVVPSLLPVAGAGNKTAEAFTVYTATQWSYHVKRSVALLLGLDNESITVTPTMMTQHLDGKIWYPSLVACHAALAAWVSKYPVKLILGREEDFLYSPKRNSTQIEIHSDLGDKGEILGTRVCLELDLGAEGIFQEEIMDQTCLGALGIYKHNAIKINGTGLRTNIPPQGSMAGFGLAQGHFAAERHISRIADTLGQDPAEWRKKNSLQKSMSFATGTVIKNSVPLTELIDTAASMSDYYRKWASYELLRNHRRQEKWALSDPPRGIGIATACQGSGFLNSEEANGNRCAVEITLEKDGSLEIKTSLASSGIWHLSNWQNIAKEILGVNPALVILTGNTGKAPDSGPGALSRNICTTSKLVENCCTAIKNQRFRNPLPITVKRSDIPTKTPGWIPDKHIDSDAFSRPSWAAAIAEIEIDLVSFEPLIRGIWLVVDGGRILNERRAARALKTGTIQALAWASREHLRYHAGRIPVEYYRSYEIPSPEELPPIELEFIGGSSAIIKGIGDLPFACVPAAYVQALSQAMDHHFENIPLNAYDILDAWKQKQAESS
jgi:CO/xanthine dehydrogenase Mo-binding subunit